MDKNNKPIVSIIIPTYNRCNDVFMLLDSILASKYPKESLEIIVVDNASTDGTAEKVSEKYEKEQFLCLIRLERNMMAAGGRNVGIKAARGKYLLFADSDNIISAEMIAVLVAEMEKDDNIGLIGPIMLYYKDPNRIWFAGNSINRVTSKVNYWHSNENINECCLEDIYETDHLPNLMMVRKSALETLRNPLFDPQYYIMYEEADFAERIRRGGHKVLCCSKAITYHNIPLPEEITENEMRKLGCDNPLRTYHFSKNRNIYMGRYAKPYGKLVYFLIFRYIFMFFYCIMALKNKRSDVALAYFKGTFYRDQNKMW